MNKDPMNKCCQETLAHCKGIVAKRYDELSIERTRVTKNSPRFYGINGSTQELNDLLTRLNNEETQ